MINLLVCHWDWLHGMPILPPDPVIELVSDATTRSRSGAQFPAYPMRYTASEAIEDAWACTQVEETAIANQELQAAVENVLRRLPSLGARPFLLRCDNLVAVSYLRKGGGRIEALRDLAWQLTRALVEAHLVLTGAYWLPSADNVLCDRLSREERRQELALSRRARDRIWEEMRVHGWPLPTVDGMASAVAHVVPRYVARFPDPDAFGVDIFHCSLRGEIVFCNPPWGVATRLFRHIEQQRWQAYVLVPDWTEFQTYVAAAHRRGHLVMFPPDTLEVYGPLSGLHMCLGKMWLLYIVPQ